ncbi:MAG: M23 family metallopeptidase [Candidatus Krumholzibacteriota bacterium]|nr:M23 family metallopeptidase [Candidatus Krumholzibacteriota bacterium]
MKGTLLRCALIAALTASAARAEVYLWPLHGPRRLSSSFGEYRGGHYHAGIDLRTGGRIGLPCRAIGDGWVSRLRIGPAGYGKALYLRLDDGRTAVYAHVEGFTRSLDSLAFDRRLDSGSSWCDIRLTRGRWRVAAGDTICWSGASGTSAPHLHFEMRDERGRPFDPLDGLFAVPDESAPIFSGLRAIPASRGGRVSGRLLPAERLFRATRSGFVLPDTLYADGAIGFAVSVWDEQGYGRYAMAPSRIELLVDGERVYLIENRSFSYDQSGEIVFETDARGEGPANRYTALFRRPGNTREDRSGPGIVRRPGEPGGGRALAAGLHRGAIVATDAAGNESRAAFVFGLHDAPVVEETRRLESGTGVVVAAADPDGGAVAGRLWGRAGENPWRPISLSPIGRALRGDAAPGEDLFRFEARDDEGEVVTAWFASPPARGEAEMAFCELVCVPAEHGLVVRGILDAVPAEPPRMRLGRRKPAAVACARERECEAFFPHDAVSGETVLFALDGRDRRGYPVEGRKAARILRLGAADEPRFDAGDGLIVELRAERAFDTTLVAVAEEPLPGPPPPGLRPVGRPFALDFLPWRVGRLRLLCEAGEATGLFRWDERRGWRCNGVPAREEGRVDVDEPGVYAFFLDGLPPEVRFVAREERPAASGFYRSRALYVEVDETGSGIDPWSAAVTLDNRPAVCEWDGIRKRLYVLVPAGRPGGALVVGVEISDRAGNRSAGEFGLTLEETAEGER